MLLLIDYICRNLKKSGTITISADLAHPFVSKLRKKDCATTITEPLLLLCGIGILRRVHPAMFAHIKTSAVYCFADPYRKNRFRLRLFCRRSWRKNSHPLMTVAKTDSIVNIRFVNNYWQTSRQ